MSTLVALSTRVRASSGTAVVLVVLVVLAVRGRRGGCRRCRAPWRDVSIRQYQKAPRGQEVGTGRLDAHAHAHALLVGRLRVSGAHQVDFRRSNPGPDVLVLVLVPVLVLVLL